MVYCRQTRERERERERERDISTVKEFDFEKNRAY
jgi:hypothetical protein